MAYSIRIRLLPLSASEERSFETCQLFRRHWEITSESGEVNRVSGLGVIGKFPLLRIGGYRDDCQGLSRQNGSQVMHGEDRDGVFVYQSRTGRLGASGSFGGEIEFVPGSLKNPTGPSIRVRLGTLNLSRPDFCY